MFIRICDRSIEDSVEKSSRDVEDTDVEEKLEPLELLEIKGFHAGLTKLESTPIKIQLQLTYLGQITRLSFDVKILD
jgi:hypothetical protein